MTDILEGVRVIEMGHVVCVPAATSMMGDCGADVIKVEPLTGDQSRTFRGTEVNPGFYLHNRSKKSIAIDLRQQAGKEIVYKMVGEHDVFLTNYQAGSLQRLGLDYETLCGIKANIIYGIVSAYGTVGPDKDMAGYDFAAGWARSGIQDMLSVPGTPPPASRPGIIDRVSSMQVFGGVCAALYHREHTGEGQKVEFNLYHTGVWMVGADIMDALMGLPLRRVDPKVSANPFYDVYECKDGRWLQLTAADRYAKAHDPVGAKFWQSFCRVLDRPDLANDPRFATTDMRQQHSDVLTPMINEAFKTRTYAEWEVRLRDENLMYGPILSPEQVIEDPQALANDFFEEVDQPGVGTFRTINSPNKFVQNPASIKSTTPGLGEQTDEILGELGYNTSGINELREAKVIL
jgi:crotonobetainyl-CoA:carnitine CoA-transferase CaiB-like acyl-CoA transferase